MKEGTEHPLCRARSRYFSNYGAGLVSALHGQKACRLRAGTGLTQSGFFGEKMSLQK